MLHRVIYLISLYCLSIIAVRDHSTASLGNHLFSHLQNLAPKLKRNKVRRRWEEKQHTNCFLPEHKQLSKLDSTHVPRRGKMHYFGAWNGLFSIRKQDTSLTHSQLLLTYLHHQTGLEKGMEGKQLHTCGQYKCKYSEVLFASNPDAKLSRLIRASFGGKLWLE